ncbi:extracellular solute-binding protein [Paenibacillus sp. HB172176]|uniref:extracellular solute-binding protein n=1 Tax=Paenibacillus sp. HB172176 TaxID=2493690 RepID=UPI00143C55FE|nr:extracellular solute-binding protein [Paenibacillus sp. HB172176]
MANGKKKWRFASFALVLALSLALSACSGNNGGNANNNNGEASKTPASTNDAGGKTEGGDEPIELTWMVNQVVLPDSEGQKYLEEKFNVKLNIISVAYADYVQRQQIMLTTGEVPDVMTVMDPNQLFKYADQGLLAEVPIETIEQYAPRTKKELDDFAPQGWYYTNYNGTNYGVPTFYGGKSTTPVTWRTDLLEKAGVTEIPDTIDEMTEAFAKLKKIGVYGLSSNGNSFYAAFQKIFGAYGVMPTQWMEKDGQVINGAVAPEAKEALAKLAEWYKAGYIDPEFVTGKDLGPKYIDGVYAFGDNASIYGLDESDPNSSISALKNANPDGKLEFGQFPAGPNGDRGGWSWGTAGNAMAFGKQLEKEPEKLQRALEMIDALINDEETFVRMSYGIQGTHWDFANGKDLTEGIKFLPPYDDNVKLNEEGLDKSKTLFAGRPNSTIFYKYFGDKYMEINEKYAQYPVADLFGKADIMPSSGEYWGDLLKLKVEAYAKIIRGDEPIEYFDSFVKQWNELGGAQLQKEAQELYDSTK